MWQTCWVVQQFDLWHFTRRSLASTVWRIFKKKMRTLQKSGLSVWYGSLLKTFTSVRGSYFVKTDYALCEPPCRRSWFEIYMAVGSVDIWDKTRQLAILRSNFLVIIKVSYCQCGEQMLCVPSFKGTFAEYRSLRSTSYPRWNMGRFVHRFCIGSASYITGSGFHGRRGWQIFKDSTLHPLPHDFRRIPYSQVLLLWSGAFTWCP